MAVDPPRTEGGPFYEVGPNGFPWDPYEWRAETGIAFPMDLGEVASACERCGYCPSQEIIDAGFTLDAARMVLRNFLFHGRQHEQEQRCPEAVEAVTAEPQADKSDYNVILETFMENFCGPLRPQLIKRLAKQLRDAHKNKTCRLPPYVGKPRRGQRHAYKAAELMKDWARLRGHIPELPPLKQFTTKTISTVK
jgi:hypothetical protein